MDMQSRNRKVLIIDDNKDLKDIYGQYFTQAGFEVFTSDNGLAGITDVVDINPTVILVDALMPEMDGFEFLSNLKNNTSVSTPVVVISNLSDEKDKQKALENGADLYIVKTDIPAEQIVEKVSKFLLNWQGKPKDESL